MYLLLDYLRLRIKYGVKFELLPIVTLKSIGNYRGISLYNAINNRFKDKSAFDWNLIKDEKNKIKDAEIRGWGEILIDQLYEKFDGVLSMERRIKLLLKEFGIQYNLRNI